MYKIFILTCMNLPPNTKDGPKEIRFRQVLILLYLSKKNCNMAFFGFLMFIFCLQYIDLYKLLIKEENSYS